MIRRASFPLLIAAAVLAPCPLGAQDAPVPDSIALVGNRRISRETILLNAGFAAGKPLSYRGVQQGIRELFATGQFNDVGVEFETVDGRNVLRVRVKERPLLTRWTLRGVEELSERAVRDVGLLLEGRPLDPALLERARQRVDSMYHARGYAQAYVDVQRRYESDSSLVAIVFDVREGRRVAISQLVFEGNSKFSDEELAAHIKSKPEGFLWFRSGEYDDEQLRSDITERLPQFYGSHGYIDFQVLGDTLVVDSRSGKASLILRINEGVPYRVGSFEIIGNRRFTTEELDVVFPFGRVQSRGFLGLRTRTEVPFFDESKWDAATQEIRSWYFNNGYIYASVRGDILRRTDLKGTPVVDLRWVIQEGNPAIVNRVEVLGNDVTHENVIRDAIVILPGDVFRQDALIRSYQNIANLGFFEQPMPPPDTRTANEAGDVDVIFSVTEKRTGNINFGASVGQGTGIGGFIGLEEPNLFGMGKRGRLQWQFGKNINDFILSYTDPALLGTRISSTVSAHNSRLHYRIGDLGRVQRRGGSLQLGFPLFNDRYTRLFVSYALDEQTYTGSSATNVGFRTRFGCNDCVRSTVGVQVLRDTRIDLPFPTGGAMTQVGTSHSGGFMGGAGNFQRVDLEGRWYAPLGEMGGAGTGRGVRFTLGLTTRAGFVFGNSPFFEQLFAMGGTQYGIPLRGYEEFSITPQGFDPTAVTGQASSPAAFGNAFFAMTGELGARVSQAFYISAFVDAGNLWNRPSEFNPTRLFRGAGIGAALISPLGPIGIDYALGFDRVDIFGRPDPAWKLHFKLGNFF